MSNGHVRRRGDVSSTGRGGKRRASDYYATPPWCVDRLLDRTWRAHLAGGRWLEPCVGDGAIVRAVTAWYERQEAAHLRPAWTTIDIRPATVKLCDDIATLCVGDFLAGFGAQASMLSESIDVASHDVVLTNPPFSLAFDFVRRSLELAPVVIMLLRMSWLGSDDRAEWLRANTPSVYMMPERPSFTCDGNTDSDYYAWMAWGLDASPTFQILDSTPVEVRKVGRRPATLPGQLGLPAGGK